MTVTFCGHRTVDNEKEVSDWLFDVTEQLILRGANCFFLGGYGTFDSLAKMALLSHKIKYPNIELVLVVPYLNHNMNTNGYDGTVYPEIEKHHLGSLYQNEISGW